MHIREEAIVLKTTPFEEKALLIDLFCEESGPIKIFSNNIRQPLQPYSLIECVLQKGRKELYYLKETTFLKQLPLSRTPLIFGICERLHAALSSATRDPQVYALFKAFLEHLHLAKRPKNLLASFLLKLLVHEGQLSLSRNAVSTTFVDGEWVCEENAPAWGLHFKEKEIEQLIFLATSRSLLAIDERNVEEICLMKINQVFEIAKGGT